MPLLLLQRNRKNTNQIAEGRIFPTIIEIFQMGSTFLLVVVGWIFFRAESISVAVDYIGRIFNRSFLSIPLLTIRQFYIPMFSNLFILFSVEWIQRNKKHGLELSGITNTLVRRVIYCMIIILIIWFMGKNETFIYFQF